jgi:hypothetical protein
MENNNVRKILVPLQSKTKSKKTAFIEMQFSEEIKEYNGIIYIAYLRKSTKKEEQEMSIERQNDSVSIMARNIGVPVEYLNIFEDAFTGYKVETRDGTPITKRKWWKDLKVLVRHLRKPCILLAFDPSRLTRNVPDGTTIKEFLWHHGNKQKIEYIQFSDETRWDKHTPPSVIDAEVMRAMAYSDSLSRTKKRNNENSLRVGILPATIKTPKWIKATHRGIIETVEMPYIRKAFEMKAEWKLLRDICAYLALYNINVKEGNITEHIFQNTIYIWTYYHKRLEQSYPVRFVNWTPAISTELWEWVRKTFWKKLANHWEWQENDIIGGLLTTPQWRTMSGYFPSEKKKEWKPRKKKTARQYQNVTEKIRISEKKVLEVFGSTIQKTLFEIFYKHFKMRLEDLRKSFSDTNTKMRINATFTSTKEEIEKPTQEVFEEFKKWIIQAYKQNNSELIDARARQSEELIREKGILEEKLKKYREKAAYLDYSKEEIDETTRDKKKAIDALDIQISKYSADTKMEQYLERLPAILLTTFELGSKALLEMDSGTKTEDMIKLLELSTFELPINTKKELTVKLFSVLEDLKTYMVGDIGFEPMTPCV